ncbi:MAG: uncharacterized protein QOF37_297 [Thermoleophilaceae bacterium]|nr:uncharacterized protein [Thermoleophilaceae bacterium]
MAVALGRATGAGPERSLRFARAVQLVSEPEVLFWVARSVFCSSREEWERFDSLFVAVDEGRGDPSAPPVDSGRRSQVAGRRGEGARLRADSMLTAAAARARDHGSADGESVLAAASGEERLSAKHFDALTPDELVGLRALMRRLAIAPPERRTRRARRGRRGERLDLRATIRRSHRTGGDPVEHAFRRRRRRRRRLVMLLDVSGSMEPYSRAFLQFLESGVGGGGAEAFVFATRLTRVTRALRGRDPRAAIARATAAAPDWSGGTRIGEALKEFNDRHARRGMARGAVVVILSDGWECGDPATVGREMERLRRLAHRIVWVNPRAAGGEFAPLAGGMEAAAPHVDALLSGHSVEALDAVVEAIGDRGQR